jgi:proton-translocating NADH-quinone oxidoreductase chain N
MIFSFYSIPVLVAVALIIPVIGMKKKQLTPYLGIFGSAATVILTLATIPFVLKDKVLFMQMGRWQAPFGITVAVDTLSILIIGLISIIGFFTILYSVKYIKERQSEYYALLCILLAGLLGMAHTGDMFNLFVFMELTSISAYALTAFRRDSKAFEASIKYLIIGSLGTSLYLLGVSFLYAATGTLNMADLAVRLGSIGSSTIPIAMGLVLAGLGIKLGLVPFHAWLPDAYTAAPSPIAAIFSGAVGTTAMYAVLRVVFTVFVSPDIMSVLLLLGAASMAVGAVMALMQTDLKRLLAYSSISQIGYVALALGIGSYWGDIGGVFHLMNQTFIKGLLFLSAGIIIMHSGTGDMDMIGRSVRFSPVLKYTFLIGILSLGGVPLFSGFSSKWIIYIATFEYFPLLTVFAGVVSALTLGYCFKAYYLVFLKNPLPKARIHRIPASVKIPLITLAAVCLLFGVLPQLGVEISSLAVLGLNNNLYIKAVLGIG